MSKEINIKAEATPNPDTLKFTVNHVMLPNASMDFSDPSQPNLPPLPKALFVIPQVRGVFISNDFVTVTKSTQTDWASLAEPVTTAIKEVIAGNSFPLGEMSHTNHSPDQATQAQEADSPVVEKIKEILDREIRPAVGMDGGDIVFHSYNDGVVRLHLQGSCSSCPSSTMTLKMGVENRLKSLIPEIKEVVQV